MAHTQRDRDKLLKRIRRIRGQLNAVEKSLNEEAECSVTLQTLAACRGAMDGLLLEIIDGHIRGHIVDPDKKPDTKQAKATQELLDVLRAYMK